MPANFTAMDIASFFIQLANSLPNDHIDNLKLNKLCYYAQGWSIARFGRPLFNDEIQAWDYGPVIPEVYRAYKPCGKNPIQDANQPFDEKRLSSDDLTLLTDVYIEYGKYTSSALITLTHEKSSPWDQVYVPGENRIITPEIIGDYFSNHLEMHSFVINSTPHNTDSGIYKDEDC